VQSIVEKEILTVVASLVHCCAIEKNVIVASQLYDVADVRFTLEKEGPVERSLFKSITLGTLFQI